MSAPSPLSDGIQKRVAPRERTLRTGKLFFGPDLLELNCTVTDISEGGARVRLPAGQYVPNSLWLMEVRSGIVSEAVVVWRAYPMVGLKFSSSEHVDEAPGMHGRIFRRIWSTLRS